MKFPRTIYAIVHNVTHRVYVGSTKDVVSRVRTHISLLRNRKHLVEDMQDDFDDFGFDYTICILDVIEDYHDRVKEYQWMKYLKSHIRGFGYNYKDSAIYCKYNRGVMRTVLHNGECKTLAELSQETKVPYCALYSRIVILNWDLDKAIKTPYPVWKSAGNV